MRTRYSAFSVTSLATGICSTNSSPYRSTCSTFVFSQDVLKSSWTMLASLQTSASPRSLMWWLFSSSFNSGSAHSTVRLAYSTISSHVVTRWKLTATQLRLVWDCLWDQLLFATSRRIVRTSSLEVCRSRWWANLPCLTGSIILTFCSQRSHRRTLQK